MYSIAMFLGFGYFSLLGMLFIYVEISSHKTTTTLAYLLALTPSFILLCAILCAWVTYIMVMTGYRASFLIYCTLKIFIIIGMICLGILITTLIASMPEIWYRWLITSIISIGPLVAALSSLICLNLYIKPPMQKKPPAQQMAID